MAGTGADCLGMECHGRRGAYLHGVNWSGVLRIGRIGLARRVEARTEVAGKSLERQEWWGLARDGME